MANQKPLMIYVLLACADYEESELLGTFPTITEAKKWAKSYPIGGWDRLEVFQTLPGNPNETKRVWRHSNG